MVCATLKARGVKEASVLNLGSLHESLPKPASQTGTLFLEKSGQSVRGVLSVIALASKEGLINSNWCGMVIPRARSMCYSETGLRQCRLV